MTCTAVTQTAAEWSHWLGLDWPLILSGTLLSFMLALAWAVFTTRRDMARMRARRANREAAV